MRKLIFFVFLLYIHCFKANLSSSDVQSPLGSFFAFLIQNKAPSILRFEIGKLDALFGESIPISFTVSDPDGDKVTCSLDLEGNGVETLRLEDCTEYNGLFPVLRTGFFNPRLTISDGKYTIEKLQTQPIHSQLAGALDPEFLIDVGQEIVDLKILPDGRILVMSKDPNNGHSIQRYLGDGSLEKGTGPFSNMGGLPLILLPDGKILVASAYHSEYKLSRYTQDLELDPSYGVSGAVTGSFSDLGSFSFRKGLALDDGRLLISGNSSITNPFGSENSILLVQFQVDGSLDTSFGSGGRSLLWPQDSLNDVMAFLPSNQSGFYLAGNDGTIGFYLVRVSGNGAFDPNFGSNGLTLFSLESPKLNDMKELKDGKILLSGGGGEPNPSFIILRYHPNGGLDTSFGSSGIIRNPEFISASSLHIQPDGKFLVLSEQSSPDNTFVLRYQSEGLLDSSFGNQGKLPFTGARSKISILDQQGRFLLAHQQKIYRIK